MTRRRASATVLPVARPVRRQFLRILLGGGLAVLAANVLGPRIDVGGTRYVEAVVGTPTRVNPVTRHANDAEDDLAALVFSGLMRVGADGHPVADLAQSWEVTPDALTYTFHLRPNVRWHDGTPFTAHDIEFT